MRLSWFCDTHRRRVSSQTPEMAEIVGIHRIRHIGSKLGKGHMLLHPLPVDGLCRMQHKEIMKVAPYSDEPFHWSQDDEGEYQSEESGKGSLEGQ
jgi:hypothetical protein